MKPFERAYLRAMLWFSMVVMLAAFGIAQASAGSPPSEEPPSSETAR
jgi:hypothetical protein